MRKSDLKRLIKEIVKTYLKETPDDFTVVSSKTGQEEYFSYFNREVIHSITIVANVHGQNVLFAYIMDRNEFYFSDKDHERIVSRYLMSHENDPPNIETHRDLRRVIQTALNIHNTDVYKRILHGRIYVYEGIYYYHFWEKQDIIKQQENLTVDYLKNQKIDPTTVLYQPGDYTGTNYLSYEEMFGTKKSDKTPSLDDLTLQQKQDLHLNPDLKKKVLRLPVPQLKKVADKLNMPMAQFRQYMGMAAAEEE